MNPDSLVIDDARAAAPGTVHYNHLKLRVATFANPRTFSGLADEEIHELACSIAWHGLINRLVVTPDYVILAGQRRYAAIKHLLENVNRVAADLGYDHQQTIALQARALELYANVPVEISTAQDLAGTAMADNLGRVDLSTYEIAAEIARMSAGGDTGTEIARAISKSPSYVSKALKCWRGAGEVLRAAWRAGTVTFKQVQDLADLAEEEQERAIAGGAQRGGHGRPGIEAVKDTISEVSRQFESRAAPKSYAMGVLDALRWVAGQASSTAFAEFMGEIDP